MQSHVETDPSYTLIILGGFLAYVLFTSPSANVYVTTQMVVQHALNFI